MQILSALGRAHDRLTAWAFVLAQVCLATIVFAYSYETISRYFFAAPTWWSNEVVGYALAIGTFLALPQVTREGGHIAITFVLEALPPRWSARTAAVLALASAAVCLFVAWICLEANLRHITKWEMMVRVRPIPKIWISAFLTFGFGMAAIWFLRHAFARRET